MVPLLELLDPDFGIGAPRITPTRRQDSDEMRLDTLVKIALGRLLEQRIES